MIQKRLGVLALAALVVLAGCSGGVPGASGPTTDGSTEAADDDGDTAATGGVVRLYVSDQPNAIDDFRHLNVTVSRVGFERAGGGWQEFAVDNRTVDLTRLRGDDATLLGAYDVAAGNYTTVFVHVSEVNATLTDGERVRVKLPSEKLQITTEFAVGGNESVDFVFDIAVHEAGASGKYVLRPVISESGAGVPIEPVDDESDETDGGRNGEGDADEDGDPAPELNATFVGSVEPGATATVEVTRDGSPVGNATVTVNGRTAGTTGADGRITFEVPESATELEVEVSAGDAEAELEAEFDDGSGDDSGGAGDQ